MKTKKKLKNQNPTTTKNQIIKLQNQLRIPTTTNLLNLSKKKKTMKSITNELLTKNHQRYLDNIFFFLK